MNRVGATLSYLGAARAFQEVYGPVPGRDARFDRVESRLGRGEAFRTFLGWGRIPDTFLNDIASLVRILGVEIVDQAVTDARGATGQMSEAEWSNVCLLHMLAVEKRDVLSDIKDSYLLLQDKDIPSNYRMAAAAADALRKKRRTNALPLNRADILQITREAGQLGIRPHDCFGLLYASAGDRGGQEPLAIRSLGQKYQLNAFNGRGMHPLVRTLCYLRMSRLCPPLSELDNILDQLGGDWAQLPFAVYFDPSEYSDVMGRIPANLLPQILRSHWVSGFNLRNICRAVEIVEAGSPTGSSAPAWQGLDLLALGMSNETFLAREYQDYFQAGYFLGYPAGEHFYIVPYPSACYQTMLVLRLQDAEYESLEQHGFFPGPYATAYYCRGIGDVFANLRIKVEGRVRFTMSENQSFVWSRLPSACQGSLQDWNRQTVAFGRRIAAGLNERYTFLHSGEHVRADLPVWAVRDYDDVARSFGGTLGSDGDYWNFSTVDSEPVRPLLREEEFRLVSVSD